MSNVQERINGIRLRPADVIRHPGRPQDRPGAPEAQGGIPVDDADPAGAIDEDHVFRHQGVIIVEAAAQPLDEGAGGADEFRVHILGHSPEAAIVVGQTGTGDPVQGVHDVFPVVEGIQKRGDAPEVQKIGPEPQQVAADPVEFGADDPDVLGARRYLDSGHFLHGCHIAVVVDQA